MNATLQTRILACPTLPSIQAVNANRTLEEPTS